MTTKEINAWRSEWCNLEAEYKLALLTGTDEEQRNLIVKLDALLAIGDFRVDEMRRPLPTR